MGQEHGLVRRHKGCRLKLREVQGSWRKKFLKVHCCLGILGDWHTYPFNSFNSFASVSPILPLFDETGQIFTFTMKQTGWNTASGAGKAGEPHVNQSQPHTLHKKNSKWWRLYIRHDTIKLLEENTGKTYDINWMFYVFLGQSPKAKEIKAKVNKWDPIKLKSFCTAKETIKQKDNLWTGRKYLQMMLLTMVLFPKHTNSSYS